MPDYTSSSNGLSPACRIAPLFRATDWRHIVRNHAAARTARGAASMLAIAGALLGVAAIRAPAASAAVCNPSNLAPPMMDTPGPVRFGDVVHSSSGSWNQPGCGGFPTFTYQFWVGSTLVQNGSSNAITASCAWGGQSIRSYVTAGW